MTSGNLIAGHHLAQLPMDARLGKLLLIACSLGCLAPALSIAACLSHKTPFSTPVDQQDAVQRVKMSLAATGAFKSSIQACECAADELLSSLIHRAYVIVMPISGYQERSSRIVWVLCVKRLAAHVITLFYNRQKREAQARDYEVGVVATCFLGPKDTLA